MVAEFRVVEQDSRNDEGPGEAAPPGLVGARDEAGPEAAVKP